MLKAPTGYSRGAILIGFPKSKLCIPSPPEDLVHREFVWTNADQRMLQTLHLKSCLSIAICIGLLIIFPLTFDILWVTLDITIPAEVLPILGDFVSQQTAADRAKDKYD
jgi:hypothetical protein